MSPPAPLPTSVVIWLYIITFKGTSFYTTELFRQIQLAEPYSTNTSAGRRQSHGTLQQYSSTSILQAWTQAVSHRRSGTFANRATSVYRRYSEADMHEAARWLLTLQKLRYPMSLLCSKAHWSSRKAAPHILRQPEVSNSGASHFTVGDTRILQTDTNLPAPTSIQFLDEHIADRAVPVPKSWEAGTSTMRFSQDTGGCSCLSRIYYFTRVLRALTNEAVPSVTVVRTAVRTVHDALRCISFSRSMIISQDPIEKLRALGTLLSLIPGFYHQLLKMIDCEAFLAVAESRGLAFKLEESGGLWG
ncbi:hypothetical protein ANOM_010583 [Aspergillus nomiae NRRL 13137]|uniref:Uncharacterized protein n=1 Tax=Aspergillus nomiae NRRL (strain ATCC 15546 / NRRL 13137 / CBS 260.88 / M93) TaxID=1509407 RepID=A0A0L1IMS3_ASPN3|nr:uncharacterized protein ANOM_010583 [Aspergillus nomiae NRRL 13137]KNG80911.1 hypothetical protein ANOM_010583 [Aspergillus nomiae NRRL 13137]